MSSRTERAMYVEGADGPLFAIATEVDDPLGNVVICPGGWNGGSIQANRMVMRLAHTLADAGRDVIRFDWHGSGESPGHIRYFDLQQPFSADAAAVSRHADRSGRPVGIVGFCFGARSALEVAPSIDDLASIVLVSFPFPAGRNKIKRATKISARTALREGLRPSAIRGWFQPATRRVYLKFLKMRWRDLKSRFRRSESAQQQARTEQRSETQALLLDDLVAQLRILLARHVRVLMVFGSGDSAYDHWQDAQEGELGPLVNGSDGLVQVAVIDGDLYGFSSAESQLAVISKIADWLVDDSVTAPD